MDKQIEKIIEAWGDKQKPLIVEELAELITALHHYERGKIPKSDLISEVADVEIMLIQLKIIYGLKEKDIEIEKRRKLNRTIDKLNTKGTA